MKKGKKILLISLGSLISVILLLVITVVSIWFNELRSISSIRLLTDKNEENKSGPIYEMTLSGGYYFEEFLENGGASNDQELINHVVKNITKGIIPISIEAPEIGCSSFTAMSNEGDRLFGRNYDFSSTTGMIVRTSGDGKRLATISSVDLQFLGINDAAYLNGIMDKFLCLAAPYAPLDGINSAGLSCGIYMSYQGEDKTVATNQQTDKPDLTSTTMLRMILDYATTVEEAVELVSQYDLHDSANTSFHYMVADKTGKSAILEWVPENGTDKTDNDGTKRVLKVTYNDDDSHIGENEGKNDFQYITNFIINPNYYESNDEKPGYDRYKKIEEMINPDGNNTKGVISEEYALEILETVGRRKWDSQNGTSDSNGITVWSTLYNLTDLEVTFVSNECFDDESQIFNYKFDGKMFS